MGEQLIHTTIGKLLLDLIRVDTRVAAIVSGVLSLCAAAIAVSKESRNTRAGAGRLLAENHVPGIHSHRYLSGGLCLSVALFVSPLRTKIDYRMVYMISIHVACYYPR